MTKEEKQLLLQDLCARLPYGVITKNFRNNVDVPAHMLPHVNGIKLLIAEYDLKPYLRPMESMTEEERNEYFDVKMQECERVALAEVYRPEAISIVLDWLNSHHFDYRCLIEKGLALPAKEGMYNIE